MDKKFYRDAPIVFPGTGLIQIENEQILLGLDVHNETEHSIPSTFTNLCEYLDWIESVTVFEE